LQSDDGVHIHWKGAAEIVLSSCKRWLSIEGSVQPMSAEKVIYRSWLVYLIICCYLRLGLHLQYDEFKKSIEDMGANSLRCVAFAYCPCEAEVIPNDDIANWKLPEDDLTLLGIVGIKVCYCYLVTRSEINRSCLFDSKRKSKLPNQQSPACYREKTHVTV
jgi:P-type Ca2+ transporter type 2C